MRRASASIPANLAEGCGCRSDGEMGRFAQIAMGSGSELSSHLLLSKDLEFLTHEQYADLSAHLDRVMKMLSALAGGQRSFGMIAFERKANSQ
jgi:four helix bundle protein